MIRADLVGAARKLEQEEKEAYPEVNYAVFRVKNPTVFGKSLAQLQVRGMTGAVISRLIHNEKMVIPRAKTLLKENDLVKAVGTNDSLEKLETLIGERTEIELPVVQDQVVESLLVTNKRIVDKPWVSWISPGLTIATLRGCDEVAWIFHQPPILK